MVHRPDPAAFAAVRLPRDRPLREHPPLPPGPGERPLRETPVGRDLAVFNLRPPPPSASPTSAELLLVLRTVLGEEVAPAGDDPGARDRAGVLLLDRPLPPPDAFAAAAGPRPDSLPAAASGAPGAALRAVTATAPAEDPAPAASAHRARSGWTGWFRRLLRG